MFYVRWHILDVSVVVFLFVWPFVVARGCFCCFLFPVFLCVAFGSVFGFSLCVSPIVFCLFSCWFLWGPIVNVAVVGVILLVYYHAVPLGPLGMHVFVWSVEAGPAYCSRFLLHCANIGLVGIRGALLLAQEGEARPRLSGLANPLPGPAWCT